MIEWVTSGGCLHFEAQGWFVIGLLGKLGAYEVGDLQRLVLGSSLGDKAADDREDALKICKRIIEGSIPIQEQAVTVIFLLQALRTQAVAEPHYGHRGLRPSLPPK